MTCDSSSLSARTRWVWIMPQKGCPFNSALGLTESRDGPVQPVQSCPMFFVWHSHLPVGSNLSVYSVPVQRKHPLNHLWRWERDLTATNWSKTIFSKCPTPTPAPHLHACSYLSHIVSGRGRELCCETERSSCLLMHTILMWADSIRQHFWMPHTPLSLTASFLLLMSLPPNASATTRQNAW